VSDDAPICEDFGCDPVQVEGGMECHACRRPMVACVKCSRGKPFPESPVYHVKPECKEPTA
jgi:hypothetical protein